MLSYPPYSFALLLAYTYLLPPPLRCYQPTVSDRTASLSLLPVCYHLSYGAANLLL